MNARFGKFEIIARKADGTKVNETFNAEIGGLIECFAKVGLVLKEEDYRGSDFFIWGFAKAVWKGEEVYDVDIIARGKAEVA